MYDGMPIMVHRTTFSLDEATVSRIRQLAAQWKVSQAEVIRRVVASAESATAVPWTKPDEMELTVQGKSPAPLAVTPPKVGGRE